MRLFALRLCHRIPFLPPGFYLLLIGTIQTAQFLRHRILLRFHLRLRFFKTIIMCLQAVHIEVRDFEPGTVSFLFPFDMLLQLSDLPFLRKEKHCDKS